MAEITIYASAPTVAGGPSVPSHLFARIEEFEIVRGVKVPRLVLNLGSDTVRVFPADEDRIVELIARLQKAASDLRDWHERRQREIRGG